MSTEKRYIWSIAISWTAFLALMLLAIQTGFAQSSEDAYRTETFNVSGPVSLEVQTSGGSISVEGSNNDEVRVEMFVRRRGNFVDPGEADLDEYEISFGQDGNTIKAIADRKSRGWNWNSNYSISFVVYAPTDTRTRLRTSGGSLTAKNLNGSQELRTSGGSITTEVIRGEMNLRTSGGSITMNDIQGDVEAHTSGGTIRAETIAGNLDARTSGGSIRLNGIEGKLEARTSGGSIRAEVLAPSESIELRTSGGSITITVPQEYGYDLDLDGNRVYADLVNFSGESERDEVQGSMNGGGIIIKAKTSGGSIRLEYL
ncbi:DUF4097 family beta strand repeat-containing protein [Gracilimonas sp.]|uniref:DUF4097 family beta strand repeat-containing protein n=1 Tax=Gracilimonas sp. TaxID=1974203 RepID=UPI002871155A|nr:DUF4097 family beta strand repeat-containing protein [Gracilimonas sp.]